MVMDNNIVQPLQEQSPQSVHHQQFTQWLHLPCLHMQRLHEIPSTIPDSASSFFFLSLSLLFFFLSNSL